MKNKTKKNTYPGEVERGSVEKIKGEIRERLGVQGGEKGGQGGKVVGLCYSFGPDFFLTRESLRPILRRNIFDQTLLLGLHYS